MHADIRPSMESASGRQTPLAVDMDGTLIRSDTTHELLLLCAKYRPLLLPLAIVKLLQSRSSAKAWLAARFAKYMDVAHFPYDAEALALIARAQKEGSQVALVSGADQSIVARVADHLGLFTEWKGSTPGDNLVGERKSRYLAERYPDGYRYAGNSAQDIAAWRGSVGGYAFRAPASALERVAQSRGPDALETIAARESAMPALVRSARLHQWMKNILVFIVPGLMLNTLGLVDILAVIQAFLCFGLMASGTYLLNDLFDIPDDRAHPTKRFRPLAAGRLGAPVAVAVMAGAISASVIWAVLLNIAFAAVLPAYAATTIAYSFFLKRIPILDVFILAVLFGMRVWGGAVIVDAPPTEWLMTFIGFFFLSLAIAKRFVEVRRNARNGKVAGRGYRAEDEPLLLVAGVASGYTAVVALAIYGLLAPERLIDNAAGMLALCAIIAGWFMRIWLVAVRDRLDDDPVMFAVKDKISLACLVGAGAIVLLSIYTPG